MAALDPGSGGTGRRWEDRPSAEDRDRPARGLLARNLENLDTAYFSWVMATGIVSVGTQLLGVSSGSRLTLWVLLFAIGFLTVAYTARLVIFPGAVKASLQDPNSVIGYLTIVAGLDVAAVRLAMDGHVLTTWIFASIAGAVWLVFIYSVPGSMVATHHRPRPGDIGGGWLITVVATQSLSIAASALSAHGAAAAQVPALEALAVCLWGLGVMLYLVLIVIIFMRLILIEVTASQMAPAYWIAMGATAISVRAAAGILGLSTAHSHLLTEMRPMLVGLSIILWAFGTWWIPLLIIFGIWRHVAEHYSSLYDSRLWSAVFPLGMYTVASYTLGKAVNIGFLVSIAKVWVYVGLAAWAIVSLLMVLAGARSLLTLRRARVA
ncbi:MAG: tellurite resistance/C4-dicarboxylate transporter family protein [Actinomycetota bacterium]|nr:tellurite resistance/C4-dicarboxylate transporter family protein [Actinomycetota bacterium]